MKQLDRWSPVHDAVWIGVMAARAGPSDDTPGNGPDPTERTVVTPPRLLVVEDDWFIGQDIEATASDAGYRVVGIVRSAEAAVAAAATHVPDLVLMDIRLAGTRDGIDAAIEIRRRLDIPSLFVSAHRNAGVQARAAAARPAGWLPKPFSGSQLLRAIEHALATRN